MIAVAGALDNKIRIFDAHGREQRTLTLQGDHWSIWDLDWSPQATGCSSSAATARAATKSGPSGADGIGQQKILFGHRDSVDALGAGRPRHLLLAADQSDDVAVPDPGGRVHRSVHGRHRGADGPKPIGLFGLSGDARRLVYARAPYHSNLWVLDVTSGRTTALTQGTSLIERPRISPDGTSVVFNVGHDPRTNLYTMPTSGGTPKQLTFFTA